MDHGGWYGRKSKEKLFYRIEDIVFVTAMGLPWRGRSVITPRLQRNFNVMTYTELLSEIIDLIFTTILKAFYASFS